MLPQRGDLRAQLNQRAINTAAAPPTVQECLPSEGAFQKTESRGVIVTNRRHLLVRPHRCVIDLCGGVLGIFFSPQ